MTAMGIMNYYPINHHWMSQIIRSGDFGWIHGAQQVKVEQICITQFRSRWLVKVIGYQLI